MRRHGGGLPGDPGDQPGATHRPDDGDLPAPGVPVLRHWTDASEGSQRAGHPDPPAAGEGKRPGLGDRGAAGIQLPDEISGPGKRQGLAAPAEEGGAGKRAGPADQAVAGLVGRHRRRGCDGPRGVPAGPAGLYSGGKAGIRRDGGKAQGTDPVHEHSAGSGGGRHGGGHGPAAAAIPGAAGAAHAGGAGPAAGRGRGPARGGPSERGRHAPAAAGSHGGNLPAGSGRRDGSSGISGDPGPGGGHDGD